MRTIPLTYVATGTNAKLACSFTAGEALRLSFSPESAYDATGKTFRLVLSDTPDDAPRVNTTTFTFISVGVGTLYFDLAEEATFNFPTEVYNGELWNATDGILVRRITAAVAANPRASGDAPAYPDPPIDWTDVTNTPTTLAGYGITDGGGSGTGDVVGPSSAVNNAIMCGRNDGEADQRLRHRHRRRREFTLAERQRPNYLEPGY